MDNLKIKGELELKFYKNGILIKTDKDHNLITAKGISYLLAGIRGTGTSHIISKIAIGTNSANPSSTDTAITNPVDIVITSTEIAGSSMVIKFNIGALVANGVTISEFGIITRGDGLFSRRVVTPFLKNQDLTIECTWTINISTNE